MLSVRHKTDSTTVYGLVPDDRLCKHSPAVGFTQLRRHVEGAWLDLQGNFEKRDAHDKSRCIDMGHSRHAVDKLRTSEALSVALITFGEVDTYNKLHMFAILLAEIAALSACRSPQFGNTLNSS